MSKYADTWAAAATGRWEPKSTDYLEVAEVLQRLDARVAELEAALVDSVQQQGTLIWGRDPVPVVTYIVTHSSLAGVQVGSGGSGGSGGILVADGEDEAGREE